MQHFYQTVRLSTTIIRQLCGQFQLKIQLRSCYLVTSTTKHDNNTLSVPEPKAELLDTDTEIVPKQVQIQIQATLLQLSFIRNNNSQNIFTNKKCSTLHNLLTSSSRNYSQFQQPEARQLISDPFLEEEEDFQEKSKIMSLPNVVFVLGGPGAGKGTQCSKIVEHFGFVHLSAGDLLREERNKPGSEFGELIEQHIRDGTIVPVEITCSLIARAMEKSPTKNFLIDGFPRSQNNLDGWEKEMTDRVKVLFVLFFDAPEDVCVGRCLQRGEAGSGRSDDNPESLKKRVFTYMNDTMPIIDYFKKQDLVRQIDASQDPDVVFQDVAACFKEVV